MLTQVKCAHNPLNVRYMIFRLTNVSLKTSSIIVVALGMAFAVQSRHTLLCTVSIGLVNSVTVRGTVCYG